MLQMHLHECAIHGVIDYLSKNPIPPPESNRGRILQVHMFTPSHRARPPRRHLAFSVVAASRAPVEVVLRCFLEKRARASATVARHRLP